MTSETTVCLNCGTEGKGSFCHNCGQPLATPHRITMKTFWKGVAMSFARMTPGFWDTFVGLMFHPWEVIRKYIHGKRVKYSPPITMVIQLLLYFTFIYTVLGNIFHVDFLQPPEDPEIDGGGWFLKMLLSSDILAKIVIAFALAFNCYLAYGLTTGRKYNLAEYLTAAIYMGCSFSIYNNLLLPLAILFPQYGEYVKFPVVIIIGTIALNKAFPIRQWWRKCLTWIWFIILNVFLLCIFVFIVLLFSKH